MKIAHFNSNAVANQAEMKNTTQKREREQYETNEKQRSHHSRVHARMHTFSIANKLQEIKRAYICFYYYILLILCESRVFRSFI